MRFKEFWLQFISVFVLIITRPCFICCVELIDCKMTCVLSMLKNVIFSASLLMYHQHQLILIFIKHLDSFEGLMAIIIFTALARIDVCRHNIVSPFISNLSELLPWSMMGRSFSNVNIQQTSFYGSILSMIETAVSGDMLV